VCFFFFNPGHVEQVQGLSLTTKSGARRDAGTTHFVTTDRTSDVLQMGDARFEVQQSLLFS
jgi:hypothetical protein